MPEVLWLFVTRPYCGNRCLIQEAVETPPWNYAQQKVGQQDGEADSAGHEDSRNLKPSEDSALSDGEKKKKDII